MGEVLGSRVVGEQYRDVLIPESGCEKGGDSLFDLNPVGIKTKCCCVLSCHIHFSYTLPESTIQAKVIFC
jgi:hypothetical protein